MLLKKYQSFQKTINKFEVYKQIKKKNEQKRILIYSHLFRDTTIPMIIATMIRITATQPIMIINFLKNKKDVFKTNVSSFFFLSKFTAIRHEH